MKMTQAYWDNLVQTTLNNGHDSASSLLKNLIGQLDARPINYSAIVVVSSKRSGHGSSGIDFYTEGKSGDWYYLCFYKA